MHVDLISNYNAVAGKTSAARLFQMLPIFQLHIVRVTSRIATHVLSIQKSASMSAGVVVLCIVSSRDAEAGMIYAVTIELLESGQPR